MEKRGKSTYDAAKEIVGGSATPATNALPLGVSRALGDLGERSKLESATGAEDPVDDVIDKLEEELNARLRKAGG